MTDIDNIIKLAEHQRASKPMIEIVSGNLAPTATDAETALIEAGIPLFQRGGMLVRPVVETVAASHERTTKIAQLKVVSIVYMRDLLARHIDWRRFDGRRKGLVRVDPPMTIASIIVERVGDWRFPAIAGIISTPTMRPDGSLLVERGFDPATGLLLAASPPMPPIPEQPTPADARTALTLLDGLLTEFPFLDAAAKAVALSALITPIVRPAFPVAPLHVARAPTAGSGKSFLWDVVAAIAIGQPMPTMSIGRTEEESEKRLGATMIAGAPLVSFDNVNGILAGDCLCQAVERPTVKIRILGHSEQVQVEAGCMTFFGNGNNVTISGDLTRRTIITTLDPQVERPELRTFSGNPVANVLGDRGRYIAAALTIARAYIVAGRPDLARPLASFGGWSDTVRSALIWLGAGDPVDTMEAVRDEDPERTDLRALLATWVEAIGIGPDHRRTATGAIEAAMVHSEFLAAIRVVALPRHAQQPDARLLGNYLRRRKGRVIDGMRFMVKVNHKGGSKWWVEAVKDARPDDLFSKAEVSKPPF